MIARLICRLRGHKVHPDPGDFVLLCIRCHTCVDLMDLNVGLRESYLWTAGEST